MIKGLLIGFGFLVVATLIAVGIVRYANRLPARPGRRRDSHSHEHDGH